MLLFFETGFCVVELDLKFGVHKSKKFPKFQALSSCVFGFECHNTCSQTYVVYVFFKFYKKRLERAKNTAALGCELTIVSVRCSLILA